MSEKNMEDRNKRIAELIRTYGADMDRWPTTEGLGRPQLDPALTAMRAEEQALDALIQRTSSPAPSAALQARILAIPGRSVKPAGSFSWLFTGFWRPASVAVGALMLGLFLGQLTLMQTAAVTASADTEEALFAELVLGPADGLTEFPQ